MRNYCLLLTIAVFGNANLIAQNAVVPAAVQIKTATLAAPADKRDAATVYGYANNNMLVVLRKGSNELICLADDPSKPGLSVAAYHRDLQPFMERGQQLRAEGKNAEEIFDIREKEVKSGRLKMPKQPATLYVYTSKAEDYDTTSGTVKNGYLRYVVYIPYATAESTGLPLKPEGPAMPWLMHPGTHGAHIMINPPADK